MTEKELEYHRKWRAKNREKINAKARQKRKENPFETKQYHLKKYYGLSVEEFKQMVKAQKGKCKICGREEKTRSLSVDHCHKTNKVRDLLCLSCNTGLGNFYDSIHTLQKAIDYLEKHNIQDD